MRQLPQLCSGSLEVVLPIWAAAEGSPLGPAVFSMTVGDIAPTLQFLSHRLCFDLQKSAELLLGLVLLTKTNVIICT